jgi:hypothetical protein
MPEITCPYCGNADPRMIERLEDQHAVWLCCVCAHELTANDHRATRVTQAFAVHYGGQYFHLFHRRN